MKRFWYLRRRPDAIASEIDEELTHHLELRAAELEARGMPRDEARREALRRFGDLSPHATTAADRTTKRTPSCGDD